METEHRSDAEIMFSALKPEAEDEAMPSGEERRYAVELSQEAKKLALSIVSEDLTRLRATMNSCLLYTSPSPRDRQKSRMPSSA